MQILPDHVSADANLHVTFALRADNVIGTTDQRLFGWRFRARTCGIQHFIRSRDADTVG